MYPEISKQRPQLRRFHQARWDEPIIFELSREGQRGLLPPPVEKEIREEVGDALATLPDDMRRTEPPALPELSQPAVLRHYLRLSQENLGTDLNIDVGQGTCTMKYSPKINDQLAASPQMAALHPLQDEATAQGILELMYRFKEILKEISGLDRFHHHHFLASFQRRLRPDCRIQGHHSLSRRRRLPRSGGAQGRRLGAHRRADDHQSGRHGHL